jgi:hypothetical protein
MDRGSGRDGLRTADEVKKIITGLENDFDQGLESIVGIRQYWGMKAQKSIYKLVRNGACS